MSDPRGPGDLPPDLPPEYAAAYRRGYQRAYRPDSGEPGDQASARTQEEPLTGDTHRIRGPLFADESAEDEEPTAEHRVPAPRSRPAHRADPPATMMPVLDLDEEPDTGDRWHEPPDGTDREPEGARHAYDAAVRPARPPWLVPAVLAALVLVLLVAAYGLGKLFSSSVADSGPQPNAPASVVIPDNGASAGSSPTHRPHGKPYRGPTSAAAIGGASATCETAPSVDSAGNQVRYDVSNVYDGDISTAWRCDGDGVGQKLTLELPATVRVGQVGLVPGYAKTDPRSGVDRYAENNRLTKVRWTFGDGTSVVQHFNPSPSTRALQSMRIPVVKSDRVVVEVLSSDPGERNTIAVSEVRIGRPR